MEIFDNYHKMMMFYYSNIKITSKNKLLCCYYIIEFVESQSQVHYQYLL